MSYFDPGTGKFVLVDGNIVERDALHIAEKLKEHDENLEIMCIDPAKSDINDAPFVICCKRTDGSMYRILECWELNDQVVERVILSDQHRFDGLSKLESMESIQRKLADDRYKDKTLENMSIVESAVRNRKSSFKFVNDKDELVTIYEDRPPEKGHGRIYNHS